MTYNEYTESRKNLITEANGLINEGKLDEANAKMAKFGLKELCDISLH